MKADYKITANFKANLSTNYTLTITVDGTGCSVKRNPDKTSFAKGTVVTLTAVPAVGWIFSAWSGAISGITSPATITMNGTKGVTATFIKKPPEHPVVAKQVKKFMVAYFTPTSAQQQYIAEHIDLLDLGGDQGAYSTISPMKALNPNLKVITYRELNGESQDVQSHYPFSGAVETGDWVYSAIDSVKETNPGKIIMENSGTSWDLVDNLGAWLCIEGFSDDKQWSTQDYQLYAMNECDAGITYNTRVGVICTHSLAPTIANREAIRFWAISCYSLFCLVLKDPAKSYFCFQHSYGSPYPADTGYWYPEIDTPLGEPLGPKVLLAGAANDGVYMRRFENATILRNLSMGGGQGTQKTYTVTVDGVRYTLGPEEGKIITT
jgi:hypothetical protein